MGKVQDPRVNEAASSTNEATSNTIEVDSKEQSLNTHLQANSEINEADLIYI